MNLLQIILYEKNGINEKFTALQDFTLLYKSTVIKKIQRLQKSVAVTRCNSVPCNKLTRYVSIHVREEEKPTAITTKTQNFM